MGVVSRGFRSALLVVGGLTVFWNVFLNERAKKSVKKAASVTCYLAGQTLSTYMNPVGDFDTEEAAEYNRQWVEQQWHGIGY